MNPDRFDPVRSGYSGMGDQTGAKNGTMKTFLQDASDAGARLLPNTRIREVTTDDGAATGVEGVHTDPETGAQTPVRITAPTVVVAAGSLETPALLLRSGIGGPAVGTTLRLHPASLVSGIYDEPQDPWYGPAMAGVMNEFADADSGYGFLIEAVQHFPGLFSSIVPWLGGAAHKELAVQYRNRVDWVALVKDRGVGAVTIDENGEAVHTYPFDDELDRKHLREGLVAAIRMQEAAGANQIYVAGQRFAPWQRGEDLDAYIERVNAIPIGPGGTPVFSAHQMCSARWARIRHLRGEALRRTARHPRRVDRRRQRHAHLFRREPDDHHDGAGAAHRDQHAGRERLTRRHSPLRGDESFPRSPW